MNRRIVNHRPGRKITLICGADESNHADSTHPEVGEFIVTTFSTLIEDGEPIHFPNHRDYLFAQEWTKHPKRDFLYSLLVGEEFIHTYSNLPFAVPRMIDKYLQGKRLVPDELQILLDGQLKSYDSARLLDHFSFIQTVRVRSFQKSKRRNIDKPPVVYVADTLSNQLYTDRIILQEVLNDARFVSI